MFGLGGVSTIMTSWGNGGTCRKWGTSVVLKQLSTDCLSISGPLKSCTAMLSFHNFYIVVTCLVTVLLLAFFSNLICLLYSKLFLFCFCHLFYIAATISDLILSNAEWWIRKDSEWDGHGQIEVLFWNLLGGTGKNHSDDSQCSSPDLVPTLLEYKSRTYHHTILHDFFLLHTYT